MNIAMVSPVEREGGAAVSATRLYDGLQRLGGHKVLRYVGSPVDPTSGAVAFLTPGGARERMEHVLAAVGLAGTRSYQRWTTGRMWHHMAWHLDAFRADVVNVHGFNQWARPCVEAEWVLSLARKVPMVWTLHDLWPVTGCCDYPTECLEGRTHEGCAVNTACGHFRAAQTHRELLGKTAGLVLACPSKWMATEARRHLGERPRIEVIPYGLDLDVFRPVPRPAAREALGLEAGDAVVLFVADKLPALRKGAALLVEALHHVSSSFRLVTVGGEGGSVSWPHGTLHLGPARDTLLMRIALSAADVTAVPSLIDNLPNVLLESIACGTPCAGFRVGGLPDVVREGVSGLLAEPGDVSGLAAALETLLNDAPAVKDQLRRTSRKLAETEYSLDRQARSYARLFEECSS